MTESEIIGAAKILENAERAREAIEPLTKSLGEFSLEDAYKIQLQGRKDRLKSSQQIGWKMGLTSVAKRQQMGLSAAIFGYLLAENEMRDHRIPLERLIHPKIECEIAFRMAKTLKAGATHADALASIDGVALAIEVIDSRYRNFKYFSLPDVVADNCSAGRYLFGPFQSPRESDFAQVEMRFLVNGDEMLASNSREISGHPLQSLCELATMLNQHGLALKAGDLVLAGAVAPAIEALEGQSYRLLSPKLKEIMVES